VVEITGSDFAVWHMQIEEILTAKGLEAAIKSEEAFVKRESMSKTFIEANGKAKAIILLGLETKYIKLIMHATTAREMWDKLVTVHEQKSINGKLMLQKKFYDLQMRSDESIADYIGRVEYIVAQLRDLGEEITETNVMCKMVSGLPRSYGAFVSSWMGTEPAR